MPTRRFGSAPRPRSGLQRSAAGLVVVVALLLGAPAVATEGEGAVEIPDYEELAANEAAQDFLPEEYDPPGFFSWFIYPLLALGLLAALAVGFRYFQWQPRFMREAQEKRRR